tara:strand:+ start:67 stop:276 length:210 start_codon:yes stop_codon:yes gene_type:complete
MVFIDKAALPLLKPNTKQVTKKKGITQCCIPENRHFLRIKRITKVGLSIYSFAYLILGYNIKESRNDRI